MVVEITETDFSNELIHGATASSLPLSLF